MPQVGLEVHDSGVEVPLLEDVVLLVEGVVLLLEDVILLVEPVIRLARDEVPELGLEVENRGVLIPEAGVALADRDLDERSCETDGTGPRGAGTVSSALAGPLETLALDERPMRLFASPHAPAVLLPFLLALPLFGCATTGGSFTADGYHHGEYPYAIHYSAPPKKAFLGPDWQVDNYYVAENGEIGDRKQSDRYQGRETIDLKGDGNLTRWKTDYFDLKLENRKTSAVIWVQTFPLGHKEADRNLRNLVEDYAEDLSGSGFFWSVRDGRTVKAKTYAAKIVSGADTSLGGDQAYDAQLELANLDQVRLDPNARTARIRVVLVKTGYLHVWSPDEYEATVKSPVLMRVGYYASPADFDAGLPEFESFLKLLDLNARPGK